MWCVKDRQITNWKQFTTQFHQLTSHIKVCQRSSNHKLKAIHNCERKRSRKWKGVSKIVKSQIESNSQPQEEPAWIKMGCVKDRQITNWKQFTTQVLTAMDALAVCQRSSNHKLKAIHNPARWLILPIGGVSKIVKSQIESNSQQQAVKAYCAHGCVKDRQITNWKQFTTIAPVS